MITNSIFDDIRSQENFSKSFMMSAKKSALVFTHENNPNVHVTIKKVGFVEKFSNIFNGKGGAPCMLIAKRADGSTYTLPIPDGDTAKDKLQNFLEDNENPPRKASGTSPKHSPS